MSNINNPDDIILPEPENYRAVIDPAMREIYQAIEEALGYIARQEDGPLTMHYVLRKIEQRVSAAQGETWYLTSELDRWRAIATKLLEQRDEAIHQRDLLMLFASWSDQDDQ